MRFKILPIFLAAAVLSCDPAEFTGTGASASGDVSWKVRFERVELTNATANPIRYAVVGRTYLRTALVTWCFGASDCGEALNAHLTALVNYIDIAGSSKPETEVMVLWWTPNGTTPVAYDSAVVKIR